MSALTVGSLFSGIGGLDLGLERAGMTVKWQAEVDPYCCRVLAKHWPNVPNLGDVTSIDWSGVENVDVVCGGYPCQPFSLAGARAGENDARHLWPHFAECLRVLRPRYALLENVPGHLSLGFGRVLGDLAELGFDAEWQSIPAAAVGAPHLRYRVLVVAHAHSEGEPVRSVYGDARQGQLVQGANPERVELREQPVPIGRGGSTSIVGDDGAHGHVADTDSEPVGRAAVARGQRHHWSVEPDVGRVADGIPSRMDRLHALGNAVVPQVAEFVGRRIMAVAA